MRILSALFILILGLTFGGCRKDIDDITGGPDPVIFVQTTVYGVITGINHEGLAGVTVRNGQQVRTTDENGFFIFDKAPANAAGTIIECTSSGYFSLTKTVIPIPNSRTPMQIRMTPKILSGVITAGAGGTINVGTAQVILPAGGIVDANGQAYTGSVRVFGVFLDPNAADMNQRMPGNLSAIRENGETAVLATYGMIGVELESPAGVKLNIAPGFEAEIHIPLSGEYLSTAPATIPLWHFDDQLGRWIEEGEATLTGNKYVGKVSHFSFWNCDIPFEAITLSGTIVTSAGNPVSGVYVRATVQSGGEFPPGASAAAWTNLDGHYMGLVPANTVFLLEVVSLCGEVLTSQEAGPFTNDHNLGPISIDVSENSILVEGSIEDCSNNPVSDGYVKVSIGTLTHFIPTNSDGTFEATFLNCDETSLSVTPYDLANLKEGLKETFDITGLNTIDLGTLEACIDLTEYIEFNFNGVDAVLVDVYGGIEQTSIQFNGWGPDSSYIQIQLPVIQPGNSISPIIMSMTVYDAAFGIYRYGICDACSTMTITITSLGNVGELITGTFTGTLIEASDPLNPTVPLTGSFKFIRDK